MDWTLFFSLELKWLSPLTNEKQINSVSGLISTFTGPLFYLIFAILLFVFFFLLLFCCHVSWYAGSAFFLSRLVTGFDFCFSSFSVAQVRVHALTPIHAHIYPLTLPYRHSRTCTHAPIHSLTLPYKYSLTHSHTRTHLLFHSRPRLSRLFP